MLECEKPTRAFPNGRTGTAAGMQAHIRAGERGEAACDPCRQHHRGKKAYNRNRYILKTYGITEQEYDAMLAKQGGGCGLCGDMKPGGVSGRFHVDHDHATGAVRGILCVNCNVGVGNFKDDPALLIAAALYLKNGGVK